MIQFMFFCAIYFLQETFVMKFSNVELSSPEIGTSDVHARAFCCILQFVLSLSCAWLFLHVFVCVCDSTVFCNIQAFIFSLIFFVSSFLLQIHNLCSISSPISSFLFLCAICFLQESFVMKFSNVDSLSSPDIRNFWCAQLRTLLHLAISPCLFVVHDSSLPQFCNACKFSPCGTKRT